MQNTVQKKRNQDFTKCKQQILKTLNLDLENTQEGYKNRFDLLELIEAGCLV